jgi:YebC/PmpR family DNA-binding regulatory protein
MAGHSQFKNIMHRKGAQDAKRAKVFTKIIREITVAAKQSGPDIEANPRLRSAIIAAKHANMPKDRIENAMKKAADPSDLSNFEEMSYHGYAPGQIPVIVECLSDNRNRTITDVRTIFTKNGGNFGANVEFMFQRCGVIVYERGNISEDDMFSHAIESGANDIRNEEEDFVIITEFGSLYETFNKIAEKFGEAKSISPAWLGKDSMELTEEEQETLENFIDKLDDVDDVQQVWTCAN